MKSFLLSVLITLAACSIVFQSCGPSEVDCPAAENNYIDLTAEELSKVPYTGTDTLYFLDKNGDTNIVVGQGKRYYYDKEAISFHPDCPDDRFNLYQAYKIEFTPIKGDLAFQVAHIKKDYTIIVSKDDYNVEFLVDVAFIGFQNLGSPYYIDSLKINEYKYGRINISRPRIKYTYDYDTTYIGYYNKSHGILFIKSTKENEEYSLLNK